MKPLPVILGLTLLGILPACQTASYMRQRGYEQYAIGKYDRAGELYTAASEKDPGSWITHYRLGMIHLEHDRPLDAQRELELAQSIRPDNPYLDKIYDGLAEAHFRQNDAAGLTALLRKACDERGTSADYLRQAEYLAKIGDADNARVALRKAAFFADRTDASPYLVTADFYEQIGDEKNAVLALRQALHIEPDSKVIHRRLREHGVVPGPTAELEPAW